MPSCSALPPRPFTWTSRWPWKDWSGYPGDGPVLAVLAAAVDPDQLGVGPGAGPAGDQQHADLVGAEGPDPDGEGPRPGEGHEPGRANRGRVGGDAKDPRLVVAVDEPDADGGGLDDPGAGAGVAAEDDPAGVDAGGRGGERDLAQEGRQLGAAAVHEALAEDVVGAAPVLGHGDVHGALVGDGLAADGERGLDAGEGQRLGDLDVGGLGPGGDPAVGVAVQLHQRGHPVEQAPALAGLRVEADLGGGGPGPAVGRGHRVAHAELAQERDRGGLGGPLLAVVRRLGRGGVGAGAVVLVGHDVGGSGGGGRGGDGGGLDGAAPADHEGGADPERDGEHAGAGEETDVDWTHC